MRKPQMPSPQPQPNLNPDDRGLELSARFWAVVIFTGIGAGLAGAVLMRLLFFVEHAAWHFYQGDFLSAVCTASSKLRILNLLLAGILVGTVGGILRMIFGKAGGDAEGAVWYRSGRIPLLATFCKAVLAIISVGLGTSLGRESPIKQAGGAIASLLSRWSGMSLAQQQLLAACGIGAGMASAYNVPLGGALFAIEVLLGSLSLQKILPALTASVVATAASWLLLPIGPVYLVREFNTSIPMLSWAIFAGPLLGLTAVLMVRSIGWAEKNQSNGWQTVVLPMGVLTMLGAVAIWFPQLLGNGKDTVQLVFDQRIKAMSLGLLFLLPILKLLATAACLRAGARGGLFTPTMTVGALLGGGLGVVWSKFLPGAAPESYAIVGSCAVLAAATRGPISSLVIVMELTRHVDATMVPMLLATVGAVLTAGRFEARSIYSARACS